MGIQDRDWYHDRSRSRSRAGGPSSPSVFRWLLGIFLAGILVIGAVRSLYPRRAAVSDAPARVILHYPESPTESPSAAQGGDGRRPILQPRGEVPIQRVENTFRCVVDGQVIYEGTQDCREWPQMKNPGGARPTEIHANEPLPTNQIDTIYLCKAYSGGMFWSSALCSEQKATLDRSVSVPADIPWARKIALGEAAWAQARALVEPPPAQTVTAQQQSGPSGKAEECAGLEATINNFDAQARHPQSGQVQDWIKQQRQQARDRQFRLHC